MSNARQGGREDEEANQRCPVQSGEEGGGGEGAVCCIGGYLKVTNTNIVEQLSLSLSLVLSMNERGTLLHWMELKTNIDTGSANPLLLSTDQFCVSLSPLLSSDNKARSFLYTFVQSVCLSPC